MSQAEENTEKPWVSCLEAARRLKTTTHRVRNHALAGRIAIQCLPGQAAMYSAADVEGLAAELTK